MGIALFTTGDIFERGADLTVLPCSSQGHISRTAEKHVKQYSLPLPEPMPLGTVKVHFFPGAGRDTKWIAWAASVMHYTSSEEIIRSIGEHLGEYANTHPEVHFIESPLLGTGAGGLDALRAGLALKHGFEQTSTTDAVLFIYGQISTTISELRKAALETVATARTKPTHPKVPSPTKPVEIFFSYAHEDEDLMNEVRRQLVVHERNGRILKWHDRKLVAGSEWETEIDHRLNQAEMVLVFLSPHYLDSHFCYEVESQVALDRHSKGEARLIPIILRHCAWKATPFGKFQVLPQDATPVKNWLDRDEVTLQVADAVMSVVDEVINEKSRK
jgi:hypothetical protein